MAKLDHRNHRKCHRGRRDLQLCTSAALFLAASILVLLLSFAPKLTTAQSLISMAQKLKVPDLIPISSSTPTINIQLNNILVKPGDQIPAKSFKSFDLSKSVNWDADSDARYTLMLVDIDRKSNPNATIVYNQYTNLNIPGKDISSGQTLVPYEAPIIPCQPSAKHRLLMLVFQQDQNIDIADVAYIAASSGHPERRELAKFKEFLERFRFYLAAANVFSVLGEVNGVCSSATTLQPSILTLSASITVVIVMFQLVSLRLRN